MEKAELPDLPGEIVALVAPHAGYLYSGQVAGHAFKAVRGKSYETVAVLSPMHQYYVQPLLTSAHRAYQTPLGEIPIDKELLAAVNTQLEQQANLALHPVAHDKEHSLEIELPFLQRALMGDFKILPIMLRDQSRRTAKILGKILPDVLQGSSALLVASSDLSHFHPESVANQLDGQVLEALADFSPDGLFDLKEQGSGQACGLAAIAAILWASQELGGTDVTVLNYNTSAAITGDRSSVVGYGAAAITRPA
jgi:AmmeMemoRadiSam system protein B